MSSSERFSISDQLYNQAKREQQELMSKMLFIQKVFSSSVVYEALTYYYKQGLFEPEQYEELKLARKVSSELGGDE